MNTRSSPVDYTFLQSWNQNQGNLKGESVVVAILHEELLYLQIFHS